MTFFNGYSKIFEDVINPNYSTSLSGLIPSTGPSCTWWRFGQTDTVQFALPSVTKIRVEALGYDGLALSWLTVEYDGKYAYKNYFWLDNPVESDASGYDVLAPYSMRYVNWPAYTSVELEL